MEPQVILVDEEDNEVGTTGKLEAHEKGVLHRAFSVFLFNSDNKMLLQRRAEGKYHSPGLWTNTCCSHPAPDESVKDAADRRLMEEMGVQSELKNGFRFLYKADFDNGLTEHELDYVLVGTFDGEPEINPDEVAEWKYEHLSNIKKEMKERPERFTEWFKIAVGRMESLFGPFETGHADPIKLLANYTGEVLDYTDR